MTKDVPITYYKGTNLEKAIQRLCIEVDQAHKNGATVVILTDRGVDENHVAIPSLLAVSAVHQHLIQTKKSTSVKIILESGEPREVHHLPHCLVTALVPSIRTWRSLVLRNSSGRSAEKRLLCGRG